MLRYVILCALTVYLASSLQIVNPGSKYPPTRGELWPKPQYQKKSNEYFTINPSKFIINTTNQSCDILTRAIERYSFLLRNTNNVIRLSRRPRSKRSGDTVYHYDEFHKGRLREMEVELNAPCDEYPSFNMDESYDLIVSTKVKLSSVTIWGILRGLESWSQLYYFTDDLNELRVNVTHVIDFPRYSHRGLLLDTSRHFISLENILKTLDAMCMNKMNVFHWHIVDDQSFPYQSEKFPDLSAKGAFHYTMVYSKANIELIVRYARDRGIRVLPEFDVPGHTRSWGEAYPNILAKCYQRGRVIGLGPMDPTSNTTYKLLEELIQEVQQWFPDRYFHVGGDEVELDCWKSNPDLQKYMREHNMTVSELHGLFMANVIPLLGDKLKPIVWQEVFDEKVRLSSDTIIQVWKNDWVDEMVSVLNSGHRLIFSSSWYLDHLKSGGDWQDFFMADPRQMVVNKLGNTTLVDNIVGGEACMWGEVVDDTNVISRVWPRASAVSERLWSPALGVGYRARVDALEAAARRLEEHTCRMRRRGVRAQPPSGPGVCIGAL